MKIYSDFNYIVSGIVLNAGEVTDVQDEAALAIALELPGVFTPQTELLSGEVNQEPLS